MRVRRWVLIGPLGVGACLLSGCLTPPAPRPRPNRAARAQPCVVEAAAKSEPESNYLVSRTPTVHLDVQTTATTTEKSSEKTVEKVEKPSDKPVEKADKSSDKTAEPVEMRIPSEESAGPPPPTEAPEPHMEVRPVPLARIDTPSLQALRALQEHHSDEEIHEQLKPYDPRTREAMLVLLGRVAQLEQAGGINRLSPRDLAAWMDPLNALTASLRGRAQLSLGRMCFCGCIRNFGEFAPLPPEHAYFQPGEVAHVYVEVRNFSCRRQQEHFLTVLKGRLEIYDENKRDAPTVTWVSKPRLDVTATPRQDYYINFRFEVPRLPAGLHTVRIAIEDWTDVPEGSKDVPESRIAQRTLDFRVGGPHARSARPRIAEVGPPH
jgi:hypothetical protein